MNKSISSFELLHQDIQHWVYKQGWKELRPAQVKAINQLRKGLSDLIIYAPTASGKTEAAFLPLISNLLDLGIKAKSHILYVSPLKALINDQWKRLQKICAELHIEIIPWHGDISDHIKSKGLKSDKSILLITPESLEAMLLNKTNIAKQIFKKTNSVIIDEFHSFIATDRGEQLISILHRLEILASFKPRRIALSATLSDSEIVKKALNPTNKKHTEIIHSPFVDEAKIKLILKGYEKNTNGDKGNDPMANIIKDIFNYRHKTNLVFPNSRALVEEIVDGGNLLMKEIKEVNNFFAHHGFLSKQIREDIEEKARIGKSPLTIASTSTLEMGIDIGAVDTVFQVGAPPSVSSLRQRLGRSGRRDDIPRLRTSIVENQSDTSTSISDLLREKLVQTISCIELIGDNWFEPPSRSGTTLSIVAHQTLALLAQNGGAKCSTLWRIFGEVNLYGLDELKFIGIIDNLKQLNLILQLEDGMLHLNDRGERIVNRFDFYTVFSTEEEFKVLTNGKHIGVIPIHSMVSQGDHLLFASRRWEVISVDKDSKSVNVKPASVKGKTPTSQTYLNVHTKVREGMKKILLSKDNPVYLDKTACDLLTQARTIFYNLGLNEKQYLGDEDGLITWFPWVGTRTMNGIKLLLTILTEDSPKAGSLEIICSAKSIECARLEIQSKSNKQITELIFESIRTGRVNVFLPDSSKWSWLLSDDLKLEDALNREIDLDEAIETLKRFELAPNKKDMKLIDVVSTSLVDKEEDKKITVVTPTMLSLFCRSELASWLELFSKKYPSLLKKPESTSLDKFLFENGLKHEILLIEQLQRDGKSIKKLSGEMTDDAFRNTILAMKDGVDYIFQGSFFHKDLCGSADLLEKIEEPSDLGDWSYIPIECKLSSHPKPIYLVQSCAYCELLEPILGAIPKSFKLYLGGQKFEESPNGYRTSDFWMWYEQIRNRYREFVSTFNSEKEPQYRPGDHGPWQELVDNKLQDQRDLTLVAGMRKSQREKLRSAGISTIDDLAQVDPSKVSVSIDPVVLTRLIEQAQIQTQPIVDKGRPPYRLRPAGEQTKGLSMLPSPDEGDIWFDMEGYPNPITGEKLEYLFGACYKNDLAKVSFKAWWAHNSNEEKKAFDDFVTWVEQRRKKYPNLHIYHYASYEKTALANLASSHQKNISIIDKWLTQELLVDLYPIVRNGLLLGAKSYSIKEVEKLYQKNIREEEVVSAIDSVVQYAEWIKSGEPKLVGTENGRSQRLQELQNYNQKDCESTYELHDFLINSPIISEISFRGNKWNQTLQEEKQVLKNNNNLETISTNILNSLPNKESQPPSYKQESLELETTKLIAELIPYTERENKVEWWEYFNRLSMSSEEKEKDIEVIHAASFILKSNKKEHNDAVSLRYKIPIGQPFKVERRSNEFNDYVFIPLIKKNGNYINLDPLLTIDSQWPIRFKCSIEESRPDEVIFKLTSKFREQLSLNGIKQLNKLCDLVPVPKLISRNMSKHLVRQANEIHTKNRRLTDAMISILERKSIQELITLNSSIKANPPKILDNLVEFLRESDGLALTIQGPPGTGKTTLTASVISRLIADGCKVAITSQGHEVINNLLISVNKKVNQDMVEMVKVSSNIRYSLDKEKLGISDIQVHLDENLKNIPQVLGATVYTLVKEKYDDQPFDFLVVDEAGQVPLSNLLYMSQCARNILLVGDQQQLSQPARASHPNESGLSCLDFIMSGNNVVPSDKGIFLSQSWRMPPLLTKTVSDLFYNGELKPVEDNSSNQIEWDRKKQGILFEFVEHFENSFKSDEEVERIFQLVEELIGKKYLINGSEWRSLEAKDILVTAPYNVQVNELSRRLYNMARVGTVDKFQGLQAPVAIHSLTASDGTSAPRGLSFLLGNRLNVAISRAQCLTIVVGSYNLSTGLSTGVDSARDLNRLCAIMK